MRINNNNHQEVNNKQQVGGSTPHSWGELLAGLRGLKVKGEEEEERAAVGVLAEGPAVAGVLSLSLSLKAPPPLPPVDRGGPASGLIGRGRVVGRGRDGAGTADSHEREGGKRAARQKEAGKGHRRIITSSPGTTTRATPSDRRAHR